MVCFCICVCLCVCGPCSTTAAATLSWSKPQSTTTQWAINHQPIESAVKGTVPESTTHSPILRPSFSAWFANVAVSQSVLVSFPLSLSFTVQCALAMMNELTKCFASRPVCFPCRTLLYTHTPYAAKYICQLFGSASHRRTEPGQVHHFCCRVKLCWPLFSPSLLLSQLSCNRFGANQFE